MLGEEFDLDQVDAEPSYLSKLPTPSRLNDPGSSATRSSTYPTMVPKFYESFLTINCLSLPLVFGQVII